MFYLVYSCLQLVADAASLVAMTDKEKERLEQLMAEDDPKVIDVEDIDENEKPMGLEVRTMAICKASE